MPNTDILLDEDGDLLIVNGDFVIGESDQQHIQRIMISNPGDIKPNALLGASASQMKSAPYTELDDWERTVRMNLDADRYADADTRLQDGELYISLK